MSEERWESIVVVVANPGEHSAAIQKAAAVARRCGASLTLLNTFMIPQPAPDSVLGDTRQIIAASIRERRRTLETMARGLRKRGLTVRCAVEWDFPQHEAIVRYVMRSKPDVLFVESHRHGKLARWLLANTDWELIRSCPCPVWFVRAAQLPKQPNLLVAVDPRHSHAKPARLDDRLLRAAGSVAAQLGGAIDVAHAYEMPPVSLPGIKRPVRVAASVERKSQFAAATVRAVDDLAARHGVDPQRRFVVEGDTCDVLSQLARRRGIDVLLLGAVSRRRPQQPVIGTTAERVIDNVGCDLLIVKPAGFKSPVSRTQPKV